jgi:DNA-binding cell septation regulator SpoVG
MKVNLDEIRVECKILETPKMKAIIAVDFGDFLVKGFRVLPSEHTNDRGDNLWLVPPSYRDAGGRYHPIFFMPEKDIWKKMENVVWDEYHKQNDAHFKKRLDIDLDMPI